MKTLTITDAKKNLGRWLQSAGRGENVGIICGADIIALRKVEVTPVSETFAYGSRQAIGKARAKTTPAPPGKPVQLRRRKGAARLRRRKGR